MALGFTLFCLIQITCRVCLHLDKYAAVTRSAWRIQITEAYCRSFPNGHLPFNGRLYCAASLFLVPVQRISYFKESAINSLHYCLKRSPYVKGDTFLGPHEDEWPLKKEATVLNDWLPWWLSMMMRIVLSVKMWDRGTWHAPDKDRS
jgi:hypothetical protein